jgi:hypothetical protein
MLCIKIKYVIKLIFYYKQFQTKVNRNVLMYDRIMYIFFLQF